MKGNMQNMDLTIPKLIEHAERYTSDTLIVSRETDNSILKKTTGECLNQSRKIAKLLQSLKVGKGDRVATIAWNNSCLLYTSPSPRDLSTSRMPSSA